MVNSRRLLRKKGIACMETPDRRGQSPRGRPKGMKAKIDDLLVLLLSGTGYVVRMWRRRWPEISLEREEISRLEERRLLYVRSLAENPELLKPHSRRRWEESLSIMRETQAEWLMESGFEELGRLAIREVDSSSRRDARMLTGKPVSAIDEAPEPTHEGKPGFTQLLGRLEWQFGEAMQASVPLIVCRCCLARGINPPRVFLREKGRNARRICAVCRKISRSIRSRHGWTHGKSDSLST